MARVYKTDATPCTCKKRTHYNLVAVASKIYPKQSLGRANSQSNVVQLVTDKTDCVLSRDITVLSSNATPQLDVSLSVQSG